MDLTTIKNKILDALFPESPCCILCDRDAYLDERGLCSCCADLIRPAPTLPLLAPLDGLCAGLIFDEVVQDAIHRLKYQGGRYLAPRLIQFMHIPHEWKPDSILAVPLHPKRQRRRGYNQSELLARALAQRTGIPYLANALERVKDTKTQTRLPFSQRRQNVHHAFQATGDLSGRRILLIDDVTTTGSTLQDCARGLKAAGAAQVFALCACATPPPSVQK